MPKYLHAQERWTRDGGPPTASPRRRSSWCPSSQSYIARMAGLYGKPIVISTGTNHSQYTVDGNVSDHWDGHGADLGMAANSGTDDCPVGN